MHNILCEIRVNVAKSVVNLNKMEKLINNVVSAISLLNHINALQCDSVCVC